MVPKFRGNIWPMDRECKFLSIPVQLICRLRLRTRRPAAGADRCFQPLVGGRAADAREEDLAALPARPRLRSARSAGAAGIERMSSLF